MKFKNLRLGYSKRNSLIPSVQFSLMMHHLNDFRQEYLRERKNEGDDGVEYLIDLPIKLPTSVNKRIRRFSLNSVKKLVRNENHLRRESYWVLWHTSNIGLGILNHREQLMSPFSEENHPRIFASTFSLTNSLFLYSQYVETFVDIQ